MNSETATTLSALVSVRLTNGLKAGLVHGRVQSLPWQVTTRGVRPGLRVARKPIGMARWAWITEADSAIMWR